MVFRILLFLACLSLFSCKSNKQEKPVADLIETDTLSKEPEKTAAFSIDNHWILKAYDVSLFIEKKTVDEEGKANLEAALQSLIGLAFYKIEANGQYTAGNGGAPTTGSWVLSDDRKKLTLQQAPKEGRAVKPTEFTVARLTADELTLLDKDGLKVTFGIKE